MTMSMLGVSSLFPSGHETSIGSLVVVVGLLVLTSRWTTARRVSVVAVLFLVDAIAAIGLVGRYYHYMTDTIARSCSMSRSRSLSRC